MNSEKSKYNESFNLDLDSLDRSGYQEAAETIYKWVQDEESGLDIHCGIMELIRIKKQNYETLQDASFLVEEHSTHSLDINEFTTLFAYKCLMLKNDPIATIASYSFEEFFSETTSLENKQLNLSLVLFYIDILTIQIETVASHNMVGEVLTFLNSAYETTLKTDEESKKFIGKSIQIIQGVTNFVDDIKREGSLGTKLKIRQIIKDLKCLSYIFEGKKINRQPRN